MIRLPRCFADRRSGLFRLAILLLVLYSVAVPGTTQAAPAEVRGTWLTTTGPDHIRSGFNTESVNATLRQVGLNTVYVETWKNGYTNFPSPTLAALTGSADRSPFLDSSRDLVEETVIHAHRNQMAYIGWFEYGFSAGFIGSGGSPNNPLAREAERRGWLLEDQAGEYGNPSNGFAWMNPAVPEVREFLIDITLEAIDRYDLDGIQFDDRLAWPREFGWDATTASLYAAQTGRSLPSSINDTHFREWRQDKVTEFAVELTDAIEEARPGFFVSVSPSITNFSDVNFNAEWPGWQNAGLFDEYAVQVYRDNFNSFNSTLTSQTAQFTSSERGDEFVVGLRGNGTGANTPIADLELMITRSREIGAAGHSIFFSKAIVDDYTSELTAFYDVAGEGHADNPHFGPGWRPAPVVAEESNATPNLWTVDVAASGRYRIVGKSGSFWQEISTGLFAAGEASFELAGFSEVELLLDRRPIDQADYNNDGVVDIADYTVWRDSLGDPLLAHLADGDLSGAVDAGDYLLWRNRFGSDGGPPAFVLAAAPEPTSIGLLISLSWAAISYRRR